MAKVDSPYKINRIISQQAYPTYICRREIVDASEYGGDSNLEMLNCYSNDTGHLLVNKNYHHKTIKGK